MSVVDLREARLARRLKSYRVRLDKVLAANRRAIDRLYTSGMLFTKSGICGGRDLLLAHQHLLQVLVVLDRLGHVGDVPPPRKASEVDGLLAELDLLLERTTELTAGTSALFDSLKV